MLLRCRPSSAATPDLQGNLYALRQQRDDLFEELIGSEFEGLHNIYKRNISLKLKAPFMSYIVRDWERLTPVQSRNFEAVASFALGGLANAWGAGVFRLTPRDLDGFPIAAGDLEPFYNEIAAHIGISGARDDLEPYFGSEPQLLPPMRISLLASDILEGYRARKAYFQQGGITVGRSRLAVLTEAHNGRMPYAYDNLEFYRPYDPAIYNPVFTLDHLVAAIELHCKRGIGQPLPGSTEWCRSHCPESEDKQFRDVSRPAADPGGGNTVQHENRAAVEPRLREPAADPGQPDGMHSTVPAGADRRGVGGQ